MNSKQNGFNDKVEGLRGDFRCEVIKAATGEIVDEHEQHNLIMTDARTVISRLFAGMQGASLPDTFMLGTAGNKDGSLLQAKEAADGFVKDRNTIFSLVTMDVNSGDIVDIMKNSYIEYTGADDQYTGLYLYTGSTTINVTLSDALINAGDFQYYEDLPEIYTTNFTCPGTQIDPDGDDANATNDAIVKVLVSGTAITFKLELGTEYGNSPDGSIPYTEAAIFAGDDIFCMKTFPAKFKDETVIFRIQWTITF
jgi:hypothetical protein